MPRPVDPDLAIATEREIAQHLDEMHALSINGHTTASLILGWSVLEALVRRAVKERVSKPQRPGSVLEMLAFEGYVTPSQADRIRPLIVQRNRLVHGEFRDKPDAATIEDFFNIVQYVYEQIKMPEAA
jgi:hypothetical protein